MLVRKAARVHEDARTRVRLGSWPIDGLILLDRVMPRLSAAANRRFKKCLMAME